MDALIKWGIILAIVAAASVTVWKLWDRYIGEPYREAGRAELRPEITKLEAALKSLGDALAVQNKMVKQLQDTAIARKDAAAAASRAAQARVADAEARVKALYGMQPAVPNDPCASACRLLAEPL